MNPNNEDKWVEEKAKEFLARANVAIQTPEAYRQQLQIAKDFILSIVKELTPVVSKDWLPTAENINALPDPIRRYIHDLETNADPAGMVQENIILKETCKALEIKLSEAESIRAKERVFVEHIENHLRDMGIEGKVICKICGKDIDIIAKEAGVEVKNER